MRSHYLQTPRSTAKLLPKQQVVHQIDMISARSSQPELIQIYQSLKKNFKQKDFKIFGDDQLPHKKKKRSVSHQKLGKIKLPKLPRILHGDSKHTKTSKKHISQKESSKNITNQTIMPNQFLNKVFDSPEKKRTNSDLNPVSNKMVSLAQMQSLSRKTAQDIHRTKSIQLPHHKQLIIINQKIKDLTFMRPLKPLHWRQLTFQFQSLDEKEFFNMMRSYNYLKVGANTQGSYKAYLYGGNNSDIVKKCLKARGCWVILESYDENAQFVWSQLGVKRYVEGLQGREGIGMGMGLVGGMESLAEGGSSVPLVFPAAAKPKGNLVDDFIANRLNEYPLLVNAQATMQKQCFMLYLNKVVNLGSRNITKATQFYKLAEVLQRRRPKNPIVQIPNPHSNRLHNHIQSASSIGNKKSLFYYMQKYYQSLNLNPFQTIPQTLHLTPTTFTTRLLPTEQSLKSLLPFPLPCILKPGQNTNRGNGITIHTQWPTLHQALLTLLRNTTSVIVQRYITPFLYKNRKFDIRVWVLWSGRQAWWYREGYIRTSSKDWSINNTSKFVHLTNDAVQKYAEDYGRFEMGNKLSFNEFQRYLDHVGGKYSFWEQAYPEMKRIAADLFKVGNMTFDPKNRMFGYELFGLDFMIDENFKVWLIEANTNPCLEMSCTLLTRLISNMIDNVISIAVDPLFPPPEGRRKQHFNFESGFKFDLLFDGYTDTTPNLFTGDRKFRGQSEEEEWDADQDA